MKKDKRQLIILVFYINVEHISKAKAYQILIEIRDNLKISDQIQSETNTLIDYIVLPSNETRVDCVFPKKEDTNDEVLRVLKEAQDTFNKLIGETIKEND